MGVAPGRVHDQAARVLADGLSESLRAFLNNDVAPAGRAGLGGVEGRGRRVVAVVEGRDDDVILEAGLALEGVNKRAFVATLTLTTWPLMELPLTARSPR